MHHPPPVEVTRKELLRRPAAVIQRRTNLEFMDDLFEGILPHVRDAIAAAGAAPTGPPFVRYVDMASEVMEIQGGLPVLAPIHQDGVQDIELPAGPVASVMHQGTYDTIADSHDALGAWLRANALAPAGTPWEVYWVSPMETGDKRAWRTEIVLPVRSL